MYSTFYARLAPPLDYAEDKFLCNVVYSLSINTAHPAKSLHHKPIWRTGKVLFRAYQLQVGSKLCL